MPPVICQNGHGGPHQGAVVTVNVERVWPLSGNGRAVATTGLTNENSVRCEICETVVVAAQWMIYCNIVCVKISESRR